MTPCRAHRRETTPRRQPVTVPERVPARPAPARPAKPASPPPAKPQPSRPAPAGRFLVVTIALLTIQPLQGAEKRSFQLAVSSNQRFLVHRDGRPFFYLGDTAWELFHRLDRDEAKLYLQDRAKKGFTVIQAVALAEFDGLTVPNRYGHRPLKDNDPTKPDEDYFKHVDWVVEQAAELGLVVGMLPTWGDKVNKKWGKGPEIFTPANAAAYGEFLGKRYVNRPIIWILGGDRDPEKPNHTEVYAAMATGLRKGDGGRHLITYHPMGGSSSSKFFHADAWLAFNMLQSGHDRDRANYDRIARDYALTPPKPCLDGEPVYEDHPLGFDVKRGYATDLDARKACYWALFAGACGHTYGCHDIWQFWQDGRVPITHARTPWRKALDLPAAGQVQYARWLLESRPYLRRIPDQKLVASPAGKGGGHVQATRGSDGSYAFVYVPTGKEVTIDLGPLSGKTTQAHWYDPRTGKATAAGAVPRKGKQAYAPPKGGGDWVLVLDDADRKYPPPGARAGAKK